MPDEILPIERGISDLLGLGKWGELLIGPITSGIGRLAAPHLRKRDNNAQIKMYEAWNIVLKDQGLSIGNVELAIGERAELTAKAERLVKQSSREGVAAAAIEYADNNEPRPQPGLLPPDQDWLYQFWKVAENVTNEDMQRFFGIILARRASSEATVSARALEFISLLSSEEAQTLERVAGFAVETVGTDGGTAGVLSQLSYEYAHPRKAELDAANLELNMHVQPLRQGLLGSLGVFLQSSYANSFHYWQSGPGTFEFMVGRRRFKAIATEEHIDDGDSFSLGRGVGLSPLGLELVRIISPPADQLYIEKLRSGLSLLGIQVQEEG